MSPRRTRRAKPPPVYPPAGGETVEEGPDGEWAVRRVSGQAAQKTYRCPGCDQEIYPGLAHVVVWPRHAGADDRRHWHRVCWEKRLHRRRR
ncbi:MAG: ATP/GTP-binding protein [Nocardiopsaceae bacterium]|nr:ATP/GTP-binding protein [Nocardiopsaceae bacterium]